MRDADQAIPHTTIYVERTIAALWRRATRAEVLLASFLVAGCLTQAAAQAEGEPTRSAEGTVAELYDLVTFEADSGPDWGRVRSLFIDEAVIVLRTGRDSTTVFSVDGFVADFVAFIEQRDVMRTGFKEEIVRMQPMVFGDMANVLVLYEASIPGSDRGPQQGVDNFVLIRKHDRWKIVAVTNEIPTEGRPVPEALRGR